MRHYNNHTGIGWRTNRKLTMLRYDLRRPRDDKRKPSWSGRSGMCEKGPACPSSDSTWAPSKSPGFAPTRLMPTPAALIDKRNTVQLQTTIMSYNTVRSRLRRFRGPGIYHRLKNRIDQQIVDSTTINPHVLNFVHTFLSIFLAVGMILWIHINNVFVVAQYSVGLTRFFCENCDNFPNLLLWWLYWSKGCS